MKRTVHRVIDLGTELGTVVCAICGEVPGLDTGTNRFGMVCWKSQVGRNLRVRHLKKDHCENPGCTAVILDPCQLEIDHIDSDDSNNDPSNIQTLCCNCHRYKTFVTDRPLRVFAKVS